MKRVYERPMMFGQVFVPNEYVSACGEENKVYKFVCDAGKGVYGGLYDTNWNRISNSEKSYHACGATHDATVQDDFFPGYFDPDTNHNNGNEESIYIWIEYERTWSGGKRVVDRHGTSNLDMDSWVTARS